MSHLARSQYVPSPYNASGRVVGGRVICEPRRPYVAIVGAGHGKDEAPLEDSHWEVWGLNVVPVVDRKGRFRADRWFELHEMHAQSEDDMLWITQVCPVPIYLPPQEVDCDILLPQHLSPCVRDRDGLGWINGVETNVVPYPLEEVEALYGGGYWACTFAYQVALAMMEGFERIGIFGAELAYGTDRERTVEWANLSYWVGFAEARGIEIHLPAKSRLGRHTHRYGIEYDAEKKATEDYLGLMEHVSKVRGDLGMGG